MGKITYGFGDEAYYNEFGTGNSEKDSKTLWGYNLYFKSPQDFEEFLNLKPLQMILVDGEKISYSEFKDKIFSKTRGVFLSDYDQNLEKILK